MLRKKSSEKSSRLTRASPEVGNLRCEHGQNKIVFQIFKMLQTFSIKLILNAGLVLKRSFKIIKEGCLLGFPMF